MISDLLRKSVEDVPPSSWLTVAFEDLEQLFDHVTDTVFFLKDAQGRYLNINHALVERCGFCDKSSLVNRTPHDVFPRHLSQHYAAQDQQVLKLGIPVIDRMELHWYSPRRLGWCLTTKFPLRDPSGTILGLIGVSCDLRMPHDGKRTPVRLADAMEHLQVRYGDPVSPRSLSREAGMSPGRFARLIKRIFCLTPHELITQTRLEAATRLLVETEKSVADIALECGFYDHSAFTRAFRSAMNLTPTQFRMAQRNTTQGSAPRSWFSARKASKSVIPGTAVIKQRVKLVQDETA